MGHYHWIVLPKYRTKVVYFRTLTDHSIFIHGVLVCMALQELAHLAAKAVEQLLQHSILHSHCLPSAHWYTDLARPLVAAKPKNTHPVLPSMVAW